MGIQDIMVQFVAKCTNLTWRRLYYEDFLLKVIVFVYLISTLVHTCSEEIVPISVSRRLHGDAVFFKSGSGCTCKENFTYLVNERQCVNNEVLLSSKHLQH